MDTRLKQLRRELGLTLLKVNLGSKMRETVIASIENRRCKAYPKQRVALAAFYGLPEGELFSKDGFARLEGEGNGG